MKTLHVVGFKNSGKTTLVSRWISFLKERGFSVSVIKQHGHHGKHGSLKMPDENTDSMRFFQSGADMSIVSGGGAVQMMLNDTPDFERLKKLATIDQPDILLIEGFKEENGPKVVLVKNEADWDSLKQLQDIELVVGIKSKPISLPQIGSREEEQALNNWLWKWLGGGLS
ncbi:MULTISPECIES: molybdopterin-guanine dinucleotide biosynthesis protein B [Clostridia]|uniref:molybdopterin-guanine dinucleotide biosynthesis protein B n=1 Tax=Clostridia TaxID=186801 RepID=UPI000EA20069|nr:MULTISPECIES: molybdopterin-guanine dinucleotide biosynthesis protein B [Clostridia]NBJ68706.1 molybdopterin-guanine dinucleotide biosynthesis protein B [Roseburia sp. 1XD42-34]RKI80621.1 molybdopterin-guanine dinucleotide biosynthesis protein B [Clostridium sp. 1xD42-85]